MSGSDRSRLIVPTEETPRSANEPQRSSPHRAVLTSQPGPPTAASDLWPSSISKAGWRALFASWLGWMFDGYETYAFVLVMGIAVPQLLPSGSLPKASIYMGGLLSVTLLGWAVGGVVAGVFADYIGRRRTLMFSILCYAFFAGLTAVSWSYASLLVFRFFTGLGLGAEWGPGAAIVAEFWPPASRGRAAGALHSAYGFGLLLAAGIWLLLSPLGPSAWRYMFVVGVLPAFLILYVRRRVDEPALWLAANRGRREARLHLQSGSALPQDRQLVQFTLARVFSEPALRKRVGLLLLMSVTSVVGWWSASMWIPQYAAQLAAGTGSQASPAHLSSLAGLMFSIGSVVGYLGLGLLADLLGRKPTTWLYFLASLALSLCLFLLVRDARLLLVLAAANGIFSGGQFAWMTIYLPELFPTRVRGSAISLVFNSSRIVAVAGPLSTGWLVSFFGGVGPAAAMMSLIYLVGLAVTPFAGPETKATPLPA